MADPALTGAVTSGSGTTTTTQTVTYPAHSSGDLVICTICTDNATLTHTLPATGPGSETIINLSTSHTSLVNSNRVIISAFAFIANATRASGTVTVTSSGTETYSAVSAYVPTGDFNAATPFDSLAGGTLSSSGFAAEGGDSDNTATNAPSPAFTASSGAAGGLVVACIGVDSDTPTAAPAGWTDAGQTSVGAESITLSGRTALATASESVAAANWPIPADSSSTLGFIVLPAGGGGGGGGSLPPFGGMVNGLGLGLIR